jgi:hypothetical protein
VYRHIAKGAKIRLVIRGWHRWKCWTKHEEASSPGSKGYKANQEPSRVHNVPIEKSAKWARTHNTTHTKSV